MMEGCGSCGCESDSEDGEIRLTNRDLLIQKYVQERKQRSRRISPLHMELMDMCAWRFKMEMDEVKENVLDSTDGVELMSKLFQQNGELALVIVLSDVPSLKLKCGRLPPFPEPPEHKRILVYVPRDVKSLGLSSLVVYRCSNEFEANAGDFDKKYHMSFPACLENVASFAFNQSSVLSNVIDEIDFCSDAPEDEAAYIKYSLPALREDLANSVKSLKEVLDNLPRALVFETTFLVDPEAQGDSKHKKVRDLVATVKDWFEILKTYDLLVIHSTQLPRKPTARQIIEYWNQLKLEYENVIRSLDEDYIRHTIHEAQSLCPMECFVWNELTLNIIQRYNALEAHFSYFAMLEKLLSTFKLEPLNSLKPLLSLLTREVQKFCALQKIKAFPEIVRYVCEIDFQTIFIQHIQVDTTVCVWDQEKTMVESKIKECVKFLDGILSKIRNIYCEISPKCHAVEKAWKKFQKFLLTKKSWFTFIPVIFDMNEAMSKRLLRRMDQLESLGPTGNNIEWESLMRNAIKQANDMLVEVTQTHGRASLTELFTEDTGEKLVNSYLEKINAADAIVFKVIEDRVLATKSLTQALYYLDIFGEKFDLSEPHYSRLNQHLYSIFISEFEILQEYFVTNRDVPVDMPRDKPLAIAKVEWAERVIQQVNELLDLYKTLPMFEKDINIVKYRSLAPSIKFYQEEVFQHWEVAAVEKLADIMPGTILMYQAGAYVIQSTSDLTQIISQGDYFASLGYKTRCKDFQWLEKMKSVLASLQLKCDRVNDTSRQLKAMLPPYFRTFIQPMFDQWDAVLKNSCLAYKWANDTSEVALSLDGVGQFWTDSLAFWTEIMHMKATQIDEPCDEIAQVELGYIPSSSETLEEWVLNNRMFDRASAAENIQSMASKVREAVPVIMRRIISQYDTWYLGQEKYNFTTASHFTARFCEEDQEFNMNTMQLEAQKIFIFLRTPLYNSVQTCLMAHLYKCARVLESDDCGDDKEHGEPFFKGELFLIRDKFRLRPCVELHEEIFVQEIFYPTIAVFNDVKTWQEYDSETNQDGLVMPEVKGFLGLFFKSKAFGKAHYWFSNIITKYKLVVDCLIRIIMTQFSFLFTKNQKLFAKKIIDSQPSAKKIYHIIRGYKIGLSMIVTDLPYQFVLGNYRITASEVIETLHRRTQDWYKLLFQYLVADWARKVHRLHGYITSHMDILKSPIRNIMDIKRKMKALQDTRDKVFSIRTALRHVLHVYGTFRKFNMDIVERDRVKVKQLYKKFDKLMEMSEKTGTTLNNAQEKFTASISGRSEKFDSKVKKLEKEFQLQGPLAPGITQEVACDRFYSMKSRLYKLYDEYQDLRDAQKLFGLPTKEYPTLDAMNEQFLVLDKLYSMYLQITNSLEEYYKVPWSEVDIEKVKIEVQDYQAKLLKVPKHMREFSVYEYMSQQVDDFNETIPLLLLMADKSMLPRHWKRLEVLTKHPFNVESKDFNLRNIIEANVLAYKDDVEDICVSAIKEKDIEAKLNQLISDWSQVNLTFAPFKDRGELLLKASDTTEIITLIEDSIMVVASLAANRYNAPFKSAIIQWLKNLSNSLEILESWIQIQNIWGYLEGVFSGGEISRQLPAEAAKFRNTDKNFVRLISKAKAIKNAIKACTGEETMKTDLTQIAQELEECQKSLSGYLEQKRGLFPRFFFVSDPTLLEIMGQATDSHLIQHHLLDVFENIETLRFSDKNYNLIEGIMSMEKQQIDLRRPVLAVGGVEVWLNNLMMESRHSLHEIIMECWQFMESNEFQCILEMVNEFIAQVGLLGLQIYWTFRSEYALAESVHNSRIMKSINDEFLSVLNTFIEQTTKDLAKVERTKFETLVTIHVHQRDIFDEMVALNILNPKDFQWLKQARFSIDEENRCVVKITDVDFVYQNEFLGCQERLVVTPLTDRCYITCAQAIGMNLGAAPAGPAGTGKTETTKDMGRTLGKYVVVFNCSDQMDFRGLGRIFKGLAQSGSWGCFDEFNRIELPVLSVAAQQIGLLLTARREEKTSFVFSDGGTCALNREFGLFITMNPGYAGRQELPENIKYQFRSVAMMVPDRQIIKRVRMAASGFKENVYLARKFFTLYALCEEQLSKQVHYDFGLRNILSVLRTLGSQKRADPSQPEEKVVMRVLRDMNVSKLVDEDEPLFLSLIDDLFMGTTLSSSSYVELQEAIEKACVQFRFVNYPSWNLKVVQMYETSLVRHGLMLLGPTGAGKTAIIRTLMAALTTCGTQTTEMRMNPKAITAPQMFGRLDVATNDWTDGIFSVLWRKCHKVDKNKTTWLVLDGPVDAVWIENLNSVLDDNKTLTLANGDRIKMAPNSKLVFEPDNVDNASPATVSRMGMTFVSASVLPWKPCFEGWCKSRPSEESRVLIPLFSSVYGDLLSFVLTKCKPKMTLLEALYIRQTCDMLSGLIQDPKKNEPRKLDKDHYEKCFMFALMWSVGAVLESDDRSLFENFVISHKSKLAWPKPSGEDTIFEFKVTDTGRWEHWNSSVVDYIYPVKTVPEFVDILIPNVDNQRTNFLIDTIAKLEKSVLLIGEPGTAKTVMIKGYMKTYNPEVHLSKSFNFSSATTPNMVQRIIESYLEKRSGTMYGPPNFRKMSIFIDDVSMPVFNDWGDQVTNEITRQLMEQGGFYSLDKPGEISHVVDIQILAAMIHPGGGRNDIPPRLKRRFNIFNCTLPSNKSMDKIFSSIGRGYFGPSRFTKEIVDFLPHFVKLTRLIWQQTKAKMLPTPAKFHYIFNLRDLSRIWQGMCNIERNEVKNISVLYKLWRYECMRTISDRFITQTERDWFQNNLEVNAKRELGDKVYSSLNLNEGIFVDFLREPPEPVGDEEIVIPKVYELVPSLDFLSETLQRYQKQYNNATKGLPMDLVFFKDFMYHLLIISRIIRTPKGNALLVGVGGSGKQSVTRLATFIANYEMKQLVLTRSYNVGNLMDDIKILYRIAGHQGKGVTFIFTDNDIKDETFLEPINNILSSGEVANLFSKDELDEILVQMVAPMKKVDSKRPATQDNLYDFFISQAKNNLHVTLCFSPVGEKFRSRALMFPGLVSGCTIDWYYKWPPDALAAVSNHFLSNYPITGTPQVIASLMHMMGQVHTIVSAALEEYFLKFRRRSFVTPKSFLTFLDSYKDQYGVRLRKIDEDAFQRKIGLLKLDEAAVSVEELRKELVFKEKNIAVATAAANVILKSVSIKAQAAEKVKAEVEVVKAKAQELVDVIAADKKVAEGKLKAAEPALAAAEAALATIKPADIQTVKALKTPPYLIQVIMDCVIILFKEKMIPAEHKTDVDPPFLMPSWAEATKQLNNIQFLSNLFKFNKDAINDETIDLMEPYLSYRNYTKEAAQSSCGQVAGLLSWTIAMNDFYKVNKEVLPLKANLAIQQIKLDIALAEKEKAEAILAAKNKEVAAARAQLDTADKALKEVTAEGNACKTKMNAASDLITGLAGEKIRWTEQAREFKKQAVQLIGDVVILCGFLGYAGPFNQEYRTKLKERWYVALQERGIPCNKNLNVTESLVDQPTISEWNLQGLPTDDLSTQNGIIVTQASRYPLLIDPQGQGIAWIKKREEPFDLRITSLNSRYFRQNLEDALVEGKPLLIAEILEELDPVLDNVLEKNFIKQGSKYKLRLGDKDLEVQPFLFRLYITTNLANPSYTPEVSARCSIIDFTVTLKGLEEQLLARVILRERRELEDERLALIKDVTLNKRKTIELEQNLLLKLTTVKGSLVDDESVLRTLNVTKDTAIQVRRKIQIAFETEKAINLAREGFRPVANRGSILYFLICDMSLVNYMYQTSLLQFLERFNISMERSDKSDRVVERIAYIIEFLTDDVFRYKVRGLYEEHKYMFPLLLTLRIDMDRKAITFAEFNYLLKGGAALDLGLCPPKPASWITDISWLNICELNKLPPFTDLIEQVKFNEQSWKVWYGKPAPEEEFIPNYDKVKLKSFHRLLIVRAWCPDRTLMESKKYITQSLGPQFADPILFNMEAMVIESKPSTPLINFLSMGSDPTVEIETLARKLKVACQSISMGQAQEIHARKLIGAFVTEGGWALLQNCHLGLEYMSELFGYMQNVEKFHPDFRVWITTEPHLSFPMSLLQISIKFTSQPPAGLRAGLKRTYSTMSQNMFSYSQREEYTYLLFTTSFLHTVVQERRKFGPLGWNIPYEFNYADWYASCLFMQNHCDSLSKKEFVSWVTIRYMIAEVQYGGRVTDDYDKRLLNTFATVWFANDVYSNLDFQFYPGYPLMRFRENMQRYLDAIDLLPQNDPPPVYCLHPNADITYQTNTTNAMLNTVIEIQPKESTGDGEAESREVVVARLAQDMISKLPPLYEAHVCRDRYKAMGATKPLVTVLRQEIDRMQKVIRTVSVTLKDLLLAVDGIIIMNENLKDSLDNIFDARVPTAWKRGSWASSSLGFWFTELLERNEQLSNWLYNGRPEQFWMTGFFNPQGFLTAMKQEVARANRWELDVVNLTNKILGFYREGIKGGPNEGVFVYGLFLEGATWDRKRDILVESQPKILSTLMPVFHINATNKPYAVDPKLYTSPVYKKPGRTDLNFITKLWIPCEHEMETHWILRAVALLCDTK